MFELYLVGGERFLAWIGLLTISLCYYNIGKLVTQLDFKIPSFGVAVESASWAIHQMGWWYWHLVRMKMEYLIQISANPDMVKLAKQDLVNAQELADRIATVAYVGTAAGAVMIMYPLLSRHFPRFWWAVGALGMLVVLCVGVAIAAVWTGR